MYKKSIVIYGAGKLFLKLKKEILNKYNVEYICDKKFTEQEEFEGIKVLSIEDAYKLNEIYICIDNYSVARQVQEGFKRQGIKGYMLKKELSGIISLSAMDIKNWFPNGYSDENNNIISWEKDIPDDFFVMFYGKNSCLNIGNSNEFMGVTFKLGNNAEINIGNNVIINSTYDIVATEGKITIGNDCIFGGNVTIHTCNGHHIFAESDMKRICRPRDVKIGNHVWLGKEVMLFGGADIGDGSMLGARAITSSRIDKNVIAAGVPARVFRRNIVWSRDSELLYDREYFTESIDQMGMKKTLFEDEYM